MLAAAAAFGGVTAKNGSIYIMLLNQKLFADVQAIPLSEFITK